MEIEKPDCLLILGDTYSGLSVMPASNKGIKVFHIKIIFDTIFILLLSPLLN